MYFWGFISLFARRLHDSLQTVEAGYTQDDSAVWKKIILVNWPKTAVNCHKQLHLLKSRTPCICTTMSVLSYLKATATYHPRPHSSARYCLPLMARTGCRWGLTMLDYDTQLAPQNYRISSARWSNRYWKTLSNTELLVVSCWSLKNGQQTMHFFVRRLAKDLVKFWPIETCTDSLNQNLIITELVLMRVDCICIGGHFSEWVNLV